MMPKAQLPVPCCHSKGGTVAPVILGGWVLGLNAEVSTLALVSSHEKWPETKLDE